ncbi:MAG: T9SS type A sorting domain-containing protein [Bacteroidetes bacterium]|nr:T9SS type A sorting domain-containing protein [Bacteroidota bacterium]
MKKIIIQFLLLANLGYSSLAQCTATVATAGATFANNNALGTVSWGSLSNAAVLDNNYASAGTLLGVLATANTNYITAQGFGFSIPSGASICGVKVDVSRSAAGLLVGSSIKDNSVRLIRNGVISGADYASGTAWTGSIATASYGGNTNLWGIPWVAPDINASNFGVAISARLSAGLASLFLTANIDQITVTVYYDYLLPAAPLYFKALSGQGGMHLTWAETPGEQRNYYIVDKSADGFHWSRLDSVPAVQSAAEDRIYEDIDPAPSAMNYYRLSHVSANTALKIDYTVPARYEAYNAKRVLAFADMSRNIVVQSSEGIRSVQVFDAGMRPVAAATPGNSTRAILSTGALPAGLYVARVTTVANGLYTQKILIP